MAGVTMVSSQLWVGLTVVLKSDRDYLLGTPTLGCPMSEEAREGVLAARPPSAACSPTEVEGAKQDKRRDEVEHGKDEKKGMQLLQSSCVGG